jgi:TonB family protein
MQKIGILGRMSGVALLQLAALAGAAQDMPPVPPSDPKALMLQAAKLNGLTGEDVKPWHLKATWIQFGKDGRTIDQGTYEEFWVSPTKFKRTYTGNNVTQTDYGTEKGVLRWGSLEGFHTLVLDARRALVEPLPSEQAIEHDEFSIWQVDSNGMTLPCIKVEHQPLPGLKFCLSAGPPVVRLSVRGAEAIQILHNRILRFQGRAIAGDLKIVRFEKTELTAHVETIEPMVQLNQADFTPPTGAVLQPRILPAAGELAEPVLLKQVMPDYPTPAKNSHVSGTVVLQAVIDKEGRPKDLKVVSGQVMLQQAALDAVRQWEYRPTIFNGEPVEVTTIITFVFDLSNSNPFTFERFRH